MKMDRKIDETLSSFRIAFGVRMSREPDPFESSVLRSLAEAEVMREACLTAILEAGVDASRSARHLREYRSFASLAASFRQELNLSSEPPVPTLAELFTKSDSPKQSGEPQNETPAEWFQRTLKDGKKSTRRAKQ
jgi:hypothetical protein